MFYMLKIIFNAIYFLLQWMIIVKSITTLHAQGTVIRIVTIKHRLNVDASKVINSESTDRPVKVSKIIHSQQNSKIQELKFQSFDCNL